MNFYIVSLYIWTHATDTISTRTNKAFNTQLFCFEQDFRSKLMPKGTRSMWVTINWALKLFSCSRRPAASCWSRRMQSCASSSVCPFRGSSAGLLTPRLAARMLQKDSSSRTQRESLTQSQSSIVTATNRGSPSPELRPRTRVWRQMRQVTRAKLESAPWVTCSFSRCAGSPMSSYTNGSVCLSSTDTSLWHLLTASAARKTSTTASAYFHWATSAAAAFEL